MSARVVAVVGSSFVPCPAAAAAVSCLPVAADHRQLLERLLYMTARLRLQMRFDWNAAESLVAADHRLHCHLGRRQRDRCERHRCTRSSRRPCHPRLDASEHGQQLMRDCWKSDRGTADRDRRCAYLKGFVFVLLVISPMCRSSIPNKFGSLCWCSLSLSLLSSVAGRHTSAAVGDADDADGNVRTTAGGDADARRW